MKATELKTKSKIELNAMVLTKLQELFQLRMHKSTTENAKTHLFKSIRKDIARIKTVLRNM